MENKYQWLSLHLFYSNQNSRLLCSSIDSYVKWILKSGIVSNFFFIRSKKNGYHLRLRFKVRTDSLDILSNNLEEYFSTFVGNYPSVRIEPNFRDTLVVENKWKPNNSFEFVPFNPETLRFGGNIGLALSERQFQLSSRTVLKYFSQFDVDPDHDDILTQAFIFNFVFAKSLGLDLNEISLFFKQIYAQWFTYAYNPDDLDLNPYYENQFLLQKDVVRPIILSLLDSIETQDIIHDEILGDWYSKNEEIARSFINQSEYLEPRPSKYNVAFGRNVDSKNYELWAIWMDFVHLNNNRLGIINQEESFLAFLIHKTIEDIIGSRVALAY